MTQAALELLDPLADGYTAVYERLAGLRESFHRSGRLDDSNAKLDEVAKLFATYLAYRRGLIPAFPASNARTLVAELQAAFLAAARLPQYTLGNGNSIFGDQPSLVLRHEDVQLALDLVDLVRQCVDLAYELRKDGKPFDVLNEAFGHFVRDNFRGNIEDAQYMTPPEVVDFVVDLALRDLVVDAPDLQDESRHWTILDPSCGVGSFLTTFYHRVRSTEVLPLKRLRLFGQDKVERMVRLSTINLELFDVEEHAITIGNSLERGSPIDALNGTVDLILTNPPFGARFSGVDVRATCADNTPFFSGLKHPPPSIDSELLFVDRNLKLLRDGGKLLIVVPDGVISAKGTSAMLRQHLAGVAKVKAIVELPPVTFAQAGTRTKTAVLYIEKGRKSRRDSVFFSVVTDLGFQVSSRKGVQVKQPEGANQLPVVLEAYGIADVNVSNMTLPQVVARDPSCVVVGESEVLRSSWTPSHYSAGRLDAVAAAGKSSGFQMVPLGDLVEFCSDSRKNERGGPDVVFLSVLHVLGEGMIDIAGAQTYAPKTPGVPTYPGEVLISRINPRIPRICITPDFGKKTLCSAEFEVLRPKGRWDAFGIAYLLLTDTVQSQIRSLTSGTSASHNRIRTSELGNVLVPIPEKGGIKEAELTKIVGDYRRALTQIIAASSEVARARRLEAKLFGPT